MARTALVVDDSTSMRQMVSFTLKEAGFVVTEAEDGAEALVKAQDESFDLVISDLNMPQVNGLELVRGLRNIPAHKFVPILLLTTESQHEMKMQGKASGATGWIVKPFNPDQLLHVVAKVVR